MASGSLATEVPLDQLLEEEEDPGHLVCGCRMHITMCGMYQPDLSVLQYLTDDVLVCAPCEKVWESTGCGVCGCSNTRSCAPCLRRYQEYVAGID